MTPLIGVMSDNIDNYDAVASLPPFSLFPWFFVLPGLLVAALAFTIRPRAGGLDPHAVRPSKPELVKPKGAS